MNEERFAVRHADGIEVMTNERDVKIYLKSFQYYCEKKIMVKSYTAYYFVRNDDNTWEHTNEFAQYESVEAFVKMIKPLDSFRNAIKELQETEL